MTSAPQPHKTITCQQVLTDKNTTHQGWLRKRTALHEKAKFMDRIIPWTNMYVVLSQGCCYLFGSDTASKPVHPFSLYGYDKILQAGEILQKDVPWPFKLLPVKNAAVMKKTRYFSAGSEKEQKLWMTEFKRQMMFANGKGLKVSHRESTPDDFIHESHREDDSESVTLSAVQEAVYSATDDFRFDGHEDSDSDGEDYNEIPDNLLIDHCQPKSKAERRTMPLPPPPQEHESPSRRKKSSTSSTNSSRDELESRPPAPLPGLSNNSRPMPPARRRQDRPPTPPDDPPDDCPPSPPPPTPGRVNVSGMVSQFNNKPEISKKPDVSQFNNKSEIAVRPHFQNIGVKLPTMGNRPPLTSPTEESGRGRRLPSQPSQDRARPLPPPPKTSPPPPNSNRGSGDGQNEEEDDEDFIRSIYMPDISKEEASSLVSEGGEEGVYLLRAGGGPDNDYVLVVFAEQVARKYKVSKIEGGVYLVKDKPFPSYRELIDFYHDNAIPLRQTKLSRPYRR